MTLTLRSPLTPEMLTRITACFSRLFQIFLSIMLVHLAGSPLCSQVRPITPRDCVEVRHVAEDGLNWLYGPVSINRQGTDAAYLVKAPNIATNRNDYGLYVKRLSDPDDGPGKLLLSGEDISLVTWLSDGRHLTMLVRENGLVSIVILDVLTGRHRIFVKADKSILQYSTDAMGTVVAYTTAGPQADADAYGLEKHTAGEIASGYRVEFHSPMKNSAEWSYLLFITTVTHNGHWRVPVRLSVEDPFSKERLTAFRGLWEDYQQNISLSPDGRRLLFSYIPRRVPLEWENHPYVQLYRRNSAPLMVTALYDFPTRRTTIPFPAITDNSSIPVWSSDSKTFIINNASPLGSNWEKRDIEEHRISGLDSNMFWVEPDSGKIEEVFANMPVDSDRPLYWRSDGSILLRVGATTVAEFVHIEGEWKEASRFEIPIKNLYRNTPLASNGAVIVGSYEASAIPPRLFIFERATGMVKSANLNPQLNHATLAPIDAVDWVTSDGMQVRGLLLKPVGYVQGTRYPLVIQTKGNNGSFLCDSGTDHDPAFSPQPIANNGMMYLIRTFPPTYNPEDEEARFSKEYPGRIGEAVYEMGIWESAIESLDKKGLIDPTKVGIMGFSRSGWQVEFDLAQSKVRYAAATAADNIQYSFGEYSLSSLRWDSSAEEDMYGGSPFGKSLAAWLAYSVSFNLPKFHTPLLMETNGYGVHDDAPGRIPFHIAFATEVFAGLNKLKKPVEWYYYPNEEHQPDHPRARLASLERNLDWYLFWLRDYEDPDPVKREQYDRWRHLRELQREDSLSRKK